MAVDEKRKQLRQELLDLNSKRNKLESDMKGYLSILSAVSALFRHNCNCHQ